MLGMNLQEHGHKDRVSSEYIQELEKLPRLEQEGDGIGSFVGTLLASKCGAHPLFLIDEPEAFLHPHQIRRLSGILAKNAELLKRQVIIATHSSDVIQGPLAASKNVAICRLTRKDNINHVSMLRSDNIRELLSKPLLRSTAALDGVFHMGVVISEADADSRFYEALAQRLESIGTLENPIDLYFIHGGGQGLPSLAKAYKDMNVPVAIIADLDLRRNKAEYKKVQDTINMDFNEVKSLYNSSISALDNLPTHIPISQFIEKCENIFNEIKNKNQVTSEHRKNLLF